MASGTTSFARALDPSRLDHFVVLRRLSLSDLRRHGAELGLRASTFDECLNDGQMSAKVKQDLVEAGRFGLTGTPGFLIGEFVADDTVRVRRKISGAHPFEVFTNALQDLLTELYP